MTQDDIVSMAMLARIKVRGHYDESGSTPQELERFAELVAAAEREACAKVCDAAQLFGNSDERWSAKCCSEAIRARGQV